MSFAENRYVIASCKEWHRDGFEQIKSEVPGEWSWVSGQGELEAELTRSTPRYIFFLHWNWLVPESIWSKFECVCFHMTDVPYGRGGSPLQNLIVAGHSETQLTALRMVREMDAGPVYAKLPLALTGRAEEIYVRAGQLSLELVRWIVDQQPIPVAQRGEPVIFRRRTPDQSQLPDTGTMTKLFDHIRMLDAPSYPPAFIELGDYRIEFSHANIREDGTLEANAVFIQRQHHGDRDA